MHQPFVRLFVDQRGAERGEPRRVDPQRVAIAGGEFGEQHFEALARLFTRERVGHFRRIAVDGTQPAHVLGERLTGWRADRLHAVEDGFRQAPAPRGFAADLLEAHAQQQCACGAVADLVGRCRAAQPVPLALQIEGDQQPADLTHQRADDGLFGDPQIDAFRDAPRDRAAQQRAVQFELCVDTVRHAVMKVIDDLHTDHEMADGVHAEHHQRPRNGRDVSAERNVHRRIGEPQHFLRETDVR